MSTRTQDAARRYIRRGFAPIPVPKGAKNPGRRGWENLRIPLNEVERYWTNGQNVGLLTGAPSSWMVDVDLDSVEAVKLSGRFLDPTLTSGRRQRPHSHWWFRCEGAESRDFKDTDGKAKLVELRSTGRQTIVAPSLHPSGDQYVWHQESGLEVEEIGVEELEERLLLLATASLIARHLPKHRELGGGGRHDYAMALSGFLLRPGRLDEEATLKILVAAWDAGGFPGEREKREAHRDLEGIITDTVKKIGLGESVQGGPTLDEMVPKMSRTLARYWGWGAELEAASEPVPWPTLDDAALYGLPGEIVRAIEPHTEADPVAVLVNLLCAFGNAAGRGAFVRTEATKHHLNLFATLVGETSKARKGMSWGRVRELIQAADGEWADERVISGLSSGEGLIHAVRDRIEVEEDGEMKVLDPGVSDKRMLLLEGEFGKILKVMTREGNTASAVVRSAWDGEKLKTLTRNSPLTATGAHISIIGHVTRSELLRLLSSTDTENGFANRFMWICVQRSKELPFGGEWHTVDSAPLVQRLRGALEFAKTPQEIRWGGTARGIWSEVYGPLSAGKPGLFGAIVSRGEAQVLRLAALYAAMDVSISIEREHLEAALALWSYAEQSARYIFGDATGDSVTDAIVEALKAAPNGMTRTDLNNLFKRNRSAGRIDQALAVLEKLRRVRRERVETGGRPAERWFAQ